MSTYMPDVGGMSITWGLVKKSGLREATNHWLRKMGPDAAKKS
jgi:hypothetical protein